MGSSSGPSERKKENGSRIVVCHKLSQRAFFYMEYLFPFQNLCRRRCKRIIVFMLVMAIALLSLQNSELAPTINSPSESSSKTLEQIPISQSKAAETWTHHVHKKSGDDKNISGLDMHDFIDIDLEDGENAEFFISLGNGTFLKKAKDGFITLVVVDKSAGRIPNAEGKKSVSGSSTSNKSSKSSNVSSLEKKQEEKVISFPRASRISSLTARNPSLRKNKKKVLHAMSEQDMKQLLLKNRASIASTMPRLPLGIYRQLLYAREQIAKAPSVNNDTELYAPVFRNISKFKRSYELMEQILKVYVYQEGDKPVFHQPVLSGIYASEGWFMKLMEENSQYVVKDPTKAHLYYMPFSSLMLRTRLSNSSSHNYGNLIKYLRRYVRTISARYPFWNRTGGADHFLAACHDWAPHETKSMNRSIRAVCNADLREGFVLGKDVSLPETTVRYVNDPLRDLGGIPPIKRSMLAFFSGNMHGYLRTILLQHWENKDPSMKIFGPMSRQEKTKTMTYIQYMKNSKYCICPRGYEVNSPRVVEAIFYECVPVIISDNFVPPFFEILSWKAFSVIIPEKDIPRLKEILTSIPMKRYLTLQNGVRKVQKHFLWHKEPVKYDLFNMILHSVWFNRVHQLRLT